MFGQHDDESKKDDNPVAADTDQVVTPDNPSNDNAAADDSWQHPGTPLTTDNQNDKTDTFTAGQASAEPDTDNGAPAVPSSPLTTHDAVPQPDSASSNDLIDIKQEALTKLSPLVDHLDQTPDEKFRTLMMMIQASDDQSLVKEAYATALKIDDEKTRAQALLDIVNEINYFTQNPAKSE